jgi:hypothetical protein
MWLILTLKLMIFRHQFKYINLTIALSITQNRKFGLFFLADSIFYTILITFTYSFYDFTYFIIRMQCPYY